MLNDNIIVPSHEFKFIAGNKIFLQQNDLDPLSIMSKLWCGWLLADRFGILNKYSPYRIADRKDVFPTASKTPIVFSDILDNKICEIVSKYEKIVVSWSGGVDSTAVVVGLLKNIPQHQYNRITVVCATPSIEEAPRFYQMLLDQKIKVIVTNNIIHDLSNVNCDCILSGWCADQLFGSDILAADKSCYNKKWLDGLKITFDQSPFRLSESSFDILGEVYSNYINQLGIEIEQWCEFAWLFNFAIKFSYIEKAMALTIHGTKNEGKGVNVFDDFAFQTYAVTHYSQIRTNNGYDDPLYYKLPLKQYIHEYTNDQDYLIRKGKRNSWAYTKSRLESVKVLTDKGTKTFTIDQDKMSQCGFYNLSYKVGDSFRK